MTEIPTSNGFVIIPRDLIKWEWYNDVNTSHLYIHLIIKANHTKKRWKGIDIERGSFITSLSHLVVETGLSTQQVRTALAKLLNSGYVTRKTYNKYSLLSITNYSYIQNNNTQSTHEITHEITHKQQAINTRDNTQATTTNNDNNNNNDNNDNNITKKIISDIDVDDTPQANAFASVDLKNKRKEFEKQQLSWFEDFWRIYPKKTAKPKALISFKRLVTQESIQKAILEALSWQIGCRQWLSEDGKFIPYPATYLNQNRWEDNPEYEKTNECDLTEQDFLERFNRDYEAGKFNQIQKGDSNDDDKWL